jgi:hypothetical protein
MADEDIEKRNPEVVDDQEPEDGEYLDTNVWDVLNNPDVAKDVGGVLRALSSAIEVWGKNQPQRFRAQFRVFLVAQIFALAIFAGVGFLGWLGVLNHETTAALLAGLIGYWYGQREKGK